MISLLLAFVATGIFIAFDDNLISLYLHDVEAGANIAETLGFAKQYMAVMLIGLIPFAISQAFSGTLRETGDTFTPMLIGLTAVVVNCVFNYLLIFGKFTSNLSKAQIWGHVFGISKLLGSWDDFSHDNSPFDSKKQPLFPISVNKGCFHIKL